MAQIQLSTEVAKCNAWGDPVTLTADERDGEVILIELDGMPFDDFADLDQPPVPGERLTIGGIAVPLDAARRLRDQLNRLLEG